MPRDPIVPLQVRMPESIRKRLAAAAKKSGRSMNAEINSRLVRTLSEGTASLLVELKDEELQRRIAEVVIDYAKSGRTIAVKPHLPDEDQDQ
jgi:hypothetical protein